MRPGHGPLPPNQQRIGAGWPPAAVVPDLAAQPTTPRLAQIANFSMKTTPSRFTLDKAPQHPQPGSPGHARQIAGLAVEHPARQSGKGRRLDL